MLGRRFDGSFLSFDEVFDIFVFLMKMKKMGVDEFQFGQSFFTTNSSPFCSDVRLYL
jgi:hypothetical protein